MREIFYEESSSQIKSKSIKLKYYGCTLLAFALFVFAFFWLIGNFSSIDFSAKLVNSLLFIVLPCVLLVVSGIFLIKLSSNIGVDYDYTFVTGSIRVAKVIMDSKRVPIISFETSNIEKIGKVESQTYKKLTMDNFIKIEELTAKTFADANKSFFYFLINHEGEKKILIFECTDLFVKHIISFANKHLLEEDFNK